MTKLNSLRASALAIAAASLFLPQAALADVIGIFGQGVPGGPSVYGAADPTSGLYFGTGRTGISKHLESGQTPGGVNTPVLSGCGTTPTLGTGSTDTAGTVTMGATATGCVITFGTAYVSAPHCTVTWRATPLASQSYTISATAITLTQTSTSNNLIDYACIATTGG